MIRVTCALGLVGAWVCLHLAACGTAGSDAVDAAAPDGPRIYDGGVVCGDDVCQGGEDHASCASDCPLPGSICGDGICNNGETLSTCAVDCPAGGTFCGDGVCNGGESTSTCTADCQTTSCSTSPDNCTGENICISGTCVSAFGRVYHIVIFDGTMSATDANGSAWDAFGGLPDPMVRLTLNGTSLGMTSAKANTLTPAWNEYLTAVIPAGSTFVINVLDEDVTVNDTMFTCQSSPLTANLLRVRGAPYYASCSGTGALSDSKVRLYFDPQ
jgi:hypothetical protein